MKKLFKSTLIFLLIVSAHSVYAQISPFVNLLYWKSSEETSSIWASKVSQTGQNQNRFSPENLSFGFAPGFRAGFDFLPDKDSWDTKIYWTHFNTQSSDHLAVASQIIAPDFFSGFLSGNLFFGSSINWKIVMNTIDLEESHDFKIGNSFSVRPAFGLKAGSINQKIHTTWDAVIYSSTENVTNNFLGIGPTIGATATWSLIDNFNLIGNFSTAFMWGRWNIKDEYSRPFALSGLISPTTITTAANPSKLGTLMYDYFVGFNWVHPKKYPLTFSVGYETQLWSSQLRIPTFQELPVDGDLTFQGVTCSLKIDF